MVKIINNKRGWLRIVEAVIAIMIVFASVLIVVSKNKVETTNQGCEAARQYLDEIAKVEKLRYAVLVSDNNTIRDFLKERVDNPSLNANFTICRPTESCLLGGSVSEKIEVCADERIISSARGAENAEPKKIKLFIYRRSQ